MANEDLLAETNLLMAQLIEMHEQDKAAAAKAKEELEVSQKEWREKLADTKKKKLIEGGLSEEEAATAEDDFNERLDQMRAKNKEKLAAARVAEEKFRDSLLEELAIQTSLLRQILERVEP